MTQNGATVKTIEWTAEGVSLIDQTKLPLEELYVLCRDYREVAEAIKSMVVRGAPAIGVTAAMGVALGAKRSRAKSGEEFRGEFSDICDTLASTRPTAVNLFWAIARMKATFGTLLEQGSNFSSIQSSLIEEAQRILDEDIAACKAMGAHGASLVPDAKTVMTICNAGALATAGYGTALGVIRSAIGAGKAIDVIALETRPFLQGARLTAWELQKDSIPTTLITDSMAGHFLSQGGIGCCVVGADRIAANGDTANKIGTYSLAVLAKENSVPFYVAAPLSTIDLEIPSGREIPIEERSSTEVTELRGMSIAPRGIAVRNPAFDVTPNRYISAIVTERGVATPPYETSLRKLKNG